MIARPLGALAVALSFLTGAAHGDEPQAPAKNRECKDDEISVPDQRGWGGNVCLVKSEWERAKAICEGLTPPVRDPLACTCQDGDAIAACGD